MFFDLLVGILGLIVVLALVILFIAIYHAYKAGYFNE